MTAIHIQRGIPENEIERTATLYYEAFRQKLQPIFRDETRGIAVLSQSMQTDYGIVALVDDKVVGIAGFKDAQGSLTNIQPHNVTDVFGFFGGWARLLALSLFERKVEPNVLLMDGIVVDASMRGKGIGSRLLDAVIDHAGENGYSQVRLDVVDTNPRAQQLYERKGFVATHTETHAWLKPIFGFAGSTTMLKKV
ncbi:MAG: GNAT family N-acetyltransferase [Chloroflexota bacterium]